MSREAKAQGRDDRATFRGQYDGTCYQRLVREEMERSEEANALFPAPRPEDMSLKRARVREVSKAIAWKIISRYEWLGTLPPACTRFYGIFFGDICGGVACYQMGWRHAGIYFPQWLGTDAKNIAYLARGACVHWAPTGTAPKLINFSARMTGLEVAVAFSDTDAGEIGTVYQAAGWTCLGWGTKMEELVSPQGRVFNWKTIDSVAKKNRIPFREARQRLELLGWTIQPANPKLRYALLLEAGQENETLLARFRESAIPYPKRAAAS